GLLRAWGGTALQPHEWQQGLEMTTVAHARGLEHYLLRGSFDRLARLDLPAIIEMSAPSGQGTRFVLLLSMTGDHCRVLLDREYDIPSRVLNDNWLGRGHLFWRDFNQLGPRLSVGSVGDQVQRLHTLLSAMRALAVGEMPAAGQDIVFSQQTRNAVARFQQANELTPDGVVGPLTMIVLYNAFPTYTHPRLSEKGELPTTTEGAKKQDAVSEKTADMSAATGGEGS
ncbi:MAG: peptidoglycan-binding protein, partial [Burkholderiales bacterium]